MARKRPLTETKKSKLKKWVYKNITALNEQREHDVSLFKLSKVIVDDFVSRFPQEDMAVLSKYDAADKLTEAFISVNDPEGVEFPKYRDIGVKILQSFAGVALPDILVPCSRSDMTVHAELGDLIVDCLRKWKQDHKVLQAAKDKIHRAYFTLIQETRTIEDLQTVWPEVADILEVPEPQETEVVEACTIVEKNLCERGVKVCEDEK